MDESEKVGSLELNERELGVIHVSLEMRQMWHPPHNRNDRIALKNLIKKIEELEKHERAIPGRD